VVAYLVPKVSVSVCQVWQFSEPAIFEPLKASDETLFNLGLTHPGFRLLRFMTGFQDPQALERGPGVLACIR
jgi:hypothetical protein